MPDDDYYDGEGEENVYDEEVRDDLVDGDEISPEEEGFMQGYDEADEDKEDEDEDDDKKKKKKGKKKKPII